jgi:hypothetical protein
MVAFVMIVLDEFVNDGPQRAFANEDQVIQTRFLDRPNEAFRVGVEIGRTGRQADGFDTGRRPHALHGELLNHEHFLNLAKWHDCAMRDLAVLLMHLLATVARLVGPGGVRSVAAESVLVKYELLILNRSRKRSPNLRGLIRRRESYSSCSPVCWSGARS